MNEPKDTQSDAVESVVLLPCHRCECEVELKQSFDIDCESTTAWIECTGCDVKFGPLYPETQQDVVSWLREWNARRKCPWEHAAKEAIRDLLAAHRALDRQKLERSLNGLKILVGQ